MAIKRAILHLGMPKAGSTSIQNTLFYNAAILEKYGFRYLTERGKSHHMLKHIFQPHCSFDPETTILHHRSFPNFEKNKEHFIKEMLHIVKNTDCETLILSREFGRVICDSTVKNIKNFIKNCFQTNGIETTIVYLVRNPLTWMISRAQQSLFQSGFVSEDCNYFEVLIKIFENIFVLQKNFSDSLILLKFEDICLDKDGLVGCFLKAIDFPQNALENIKTYRANESRCLEVMEFISFLEAIEPLYPHSDMRFYSSNRFPGDVDPLKNIKGVKFDLPYQSKVELWNRLDKTVHLLKENTGIDYTDYTPSLPAEAAEEIYNEETIQEFIEAFPKLSFFLQKAFCTFFRKKYMETIQDRFKQLFFKGSIPWKLFYSKNAFLCLLGMRLKYKLRYLKTEIRNMSPKGIKKTLFKRKK